jgi:hypothetical protein
MSMEINPYCKDRRKRESVSQSGSRTGFAVKVLSVGNGAVGGPNTFINIIQEGLRILTRDLGHFFKLA